MWSGSFGPRHWCVRSHVGNEVAIPLLTTLEEAVQAAKANPCERVDKTLPPSGERHLMTLIWHYCLLLFLDEIYFISLILKKLLNLLWVASVNTIIFRCKIVQYIICTLYCVFTTSSQVSFHHHLFPLYPLLLPLMLSPSGNHHTIVVDEFCFTFVLPYPLQLSPL